MRQIKFRGLTSSGWIYGDLMGDAILPTDSKYYDEYGNIEKKTVGQFTGLKDKNGADVYEGDFIKIDGSDIILVVEFKKGCFYSVSKRPGTNYRLGGWEDNSFEVIGNVHENPELLK